MDDVDTETLVILHLLRVDQTIAVGAELRNLRQVGYEDGVVEDHQDIVSFLDAGGGQGDRMSRPQPLFLDGVGAVQSRKPGGHEILDLLAVLVGDENDFIGLEHLQTADDVFENGLARNTHQGLGLGMGVRTQAGSFAGDGKNDFHAASFEI